VIALSIDPRARSIVPDVAGVRLRKSSVHSVDHIRSRTLATANISVGHVKELLRCER